MNRKFYRKMLWVSFALLFLGSWITLFEKSREKYRLEKLERDLEQLELLVENLSE